MGRWASLVTAAAIVTASLGPWPSFAGAQVSDPTLNWRTLQTQHFEIHYHEPLGVVARRAATILEGAQRTLGPLLDHRPSGRVQVILTDITDSANGSASPLPYNRMRLFVTAPEDLTPLGDYDDWLSELIIHEHTHILHLDTIGGLPRFLNRVLGRTFVPNQLQPRWFIEGLAVVHESEHTTAGRLRSTMFEMYMRMEALDDRLLRIDQLSNGVNRWPFGHLPYLYGSRFCNYIQREHGLQALTEISHSYGRQAIPYALNRMAARATGRTFVELYDDFLDEEREYHQSVAQRVRDAGLREGRRLTHHGNVAISPRFLPTGEVVYSVSDGEHPSELRVIDAESGATLRGLGRVVGTVYSAPHPSRNQLVHNQSSPVRNIYLLNDLYERDLETGESRRLTEGLRASEPDIHPDGERVAYVTNSSGTRHLAIARLDDIEGTEEILVRSARFEQIYTPRFSPDGTRIAFSHWRDGGYRDIQVLDLESGERLAITQDRALDTGPTWSPNGDYLLFSSDRTGIANLYAYAFESGVLHQVTEVIAGAYQPTVSPDGERIVYLGYTADGFDLFRIPFDPARWTSAADEDLERTEAVAEAADATRVSQPYRAIRSLYPRAYTVGYGPDSFGPALSLATTAQDAVGNHALSASLSVSLVRGDPSVALAYSFSGSPFTLSVSAFRVVSARGGLQVGGRSRLWVEDAVGGSATARWNYLQPFYRLGFSASYSLTHGRKAEPFGGVLDPNTPPPRLPDVGLRSRLTLSGYFSNQTRTSGDISSSQGHAHRLSVSYAEPHLGSPFREATFRWSSAGFVEMPWREHHVLALRYGGGLSLANRSRSPFSLGGFPEPDLLSVLLSGSSFGGVALRGFAPGIINGNRFHLLQAEYRFPLFDANRGIATLPLYLGRLHAVAFGDLGTAYRDQPDWDELRASFGAELHAQLIAGYYLPLMLRAGFAYGLGPGGGPQFYVNLGRGF